MADFTRLERESHIFELLLHLPRSKESPMQRQISLDFPFSTPLELRNQQISLLPSTAAV